MSRSSALAQGVWIPLFVTVSFAASAGEPVSDPAGVEFFEAKVRPILANRCLSCHGDAKTKGGLRLDARESILKGGETGPAAIVGKPAESLLIDAVNYGESVQMPPKSRLPATEVATLTRWVEMGMPWPAERTKTASTKATFDLKARKASHWAWRPIEAGKVPDVKNAAWPLGPIDSFLLARLEAKGLTPASEAEKRVLIRRLCFDLTGLPPTPEEVAAFEQDRATGAYERLVDRLIASPHFGERWGRHWLDLVRYAETRGHEFDPLIPNAWQYRDYVTRALNADVPYNEFLTEHLAGDLLEKPRIDPTTGANESILGTGFWFLGEEVHSPVDIRQDECDRLDNRLDVMTKTFLGLTVACARCHDHKFDAISQRDYYALNGFLISSAYRQVRFKSLEREKQAARDLQTLHDEARSPLLSLAAHAIRPAIDRLAEDLLLARSKVLEGPHSGVGDAGNAPLWAIELDKAKRDPTHPFHGFATVALDPQCSDPRALATRLEGHRVIRALSRPSNVVVDFGASANLDRAQDGFGFGLRPARPGDLRIDADKGRSRLGLFDRPAAFHDSAWGPRVLTAGPERDQGQIGKWDRSSQTLRTPDFTIESGRLWYLVRGAGHAYSVVNSHLTIAGPLHGALLMDWGDESNGWRWVKQELGDYKGHRTHVEFTPSNTGNLAIAMVVDSLEEPRILQNRDSLLERALEVGPVETIEALAERYEKVFAAVAKRMEMDGFDESPRSRDDAALADWILRRLNLFGPDNTPERIAFRDGIAKLEASRASIEERLTAGPTPPTAPAMLDGNGVNEHLLIRGSSRTPGPEVPRRFLEAIAGDQPISSETGSGRLELARQMVDSSNPFARRVIVNRVWHHLFGTGIVRSVDNFGVLGDPPTRPELLDHLADQFVRDGWSIKRLIRTIVTSRAYRMSSHPDAQETLDPQNTLLHRMPIRRLEAEPIRDAILAASGSLDDRMYGPSVRVHLTDYMQGRGRPDKGGPLDGHGRRSLYIEIRRNFLSPMMLAFDAPTPFTTIGRRNVSNVPAQALILLNDPFVIDQARWWAERVLTPEATPAERVAGMYQTAFARAPEPSEIAEALAFLESQGRESGLSADTWKHDRGVWADLAHVLINSKEFVFLD